MQQILRALPLLAILALAACSSSASVADLGPTLAQPNPALQQPQTQMPMTPPPAQQVAEAQSLTDVTAFVDPAVLPQLSQRERTEAASAQFNALQFGRTGAPRAWSGDRGNSGSVLVGPPVNVNALYCRDFTHTVTAGGQSFVKKGMACREVDGRWGVVPS